MLEYMLLRPAERKFTDSATAHLEFLVLDELHTYRGRQGADVAMLLRRLRERIRTPSCFISAPVRRWPPKEGAMHDALLLLQLLRNYVGSTVKPGERC